MAPRPAQRATGPHSNATALRCEQQALACDASMTLHGLAWFGKKIHLLRWFTNKINFTEFYGILRNFTEFNEKYLNLGQNRPKMAVFGRYLAIFEAFCMNLGQNRWLPGDNG